MRAVQLILALSGLFVAGVHGQPAKFTIQGRQAPVRLEISGRVGDTYLVEQSATPAISDSWRPLITLSLPQASHTWQDSASLVLPARFYRLTPFSTAAVATEADNFRLLDDTGRSRELFYQSQERAVVLVFADTSLSATARWVSAVSALKEQFAAAGVTFWVVDTRAGSSATLQNQTSVASLDVPFLRDPGQLVTRAYGITQTPEVVCVNTADWKVFYRGALEDAIHTTPNRYAAEALTRFLAGEALSVHRAHTIGVPIDLPTAPRASYSGEIAPLLRKHCIECHSPGNIAPWAMTNYAAVRTHSSSIKAEVLAGRMPPWHADPAYGRFSNDISLQPTEAGALLRWIADGAPRGDGPDPLENLFLTNPPPKNYPFDWPPELGKPDHIITIPRQTIQATGEVPYKYPQVVANIPSNVWLRAAIVRPGNTRAVHHALVFAGSLVEVFVNGGGLGGFFAAYVPGSKAVAYPAGTGKFLAKNTTLTFQMHYTTTGQSETDQTQIGLYFMAAPPAAELLTKAAFALDIAIPPGESEYKREAQMMPSATKDVWLFEMSPHMHYRGSHFKYEALYPDGTSEVLLSVPKYEFHWQSLYRLAEPKRLPAGTLVRCSGAFDNSARNPHNPDPSVTVKFGEQTDDEMFIGYLNYAIIP